LQGDGFSFDSAKHIAAHGVVGGAANEAMGGKLADGFWSAAASAGASNLGLLGSPGGGLPGVFQRTVMAGVVGGTVAVIGGGKFANGAYTAAMQHLLNAEFEQWHHRLPQAASLRPLFEAADFDVDSPEYGLLLNGEDHRAMHSNAENYNQAWRDFFRTNPNAGYDEIIQHLNDLEDSARYEAIVARGKAANLSYNEYRNFRNRFYTLAKRGANGVGGTIGGIAFGGFIASATTSKAEVTDFLENARIFKQTGNEAAFSDALHAAANISGNVGGTLYLREAGRQAGLIE
jgi:hypothetical protein